MADSIMRFSGDYRFLSNFYPARAIVNGLAFRSVEHAYQATKTLDMGARVEIMRAATPGQAKRLGQKVELRSDWEVLKLDIMYRLVRQKFTADKDLRRQLLATGDRDLIEGNTWGDTFWGVCNGEGQNHLGKILMKVRKELRIGG